MVWLLYPAYGIIAGTIGSYLSALIFLSVLIRKEYGQNFAIKKRKYVM